MSETITTKLKFEADVNDVANKIQSLQKHISKLNLPKDMTNSLNTDFEEFSRNFAKFQKLSQSTFKNKGDVTGIKQSGNELLKIYKNIANTISKIDASKLGDIFKDINTQEIAKLQNTIDQIKQGLSSDLSSKFSGEMQNIYDAVNKMKTVSKGTTLDKFLGAINAGDIEAASKALNVLEQNTKKFVAGSEKSNIWKENIEVLKKQFNTLVQSNVVQKATDDIKKLKDEVKSIESDSIERNSKSLENLKNNATDALQPLGQLVQKTNESAQSTYELNEATDRFGSKIKYFFSATSAVRLMRKALNDAYQTVKELDAVMTETAVVTDFSVGDMWDQLPTYAANASKLGVSIKSAYESATLYYQQGLKTNEVIALSNETLKMARIAGLDAAEATDRMTNALRGFNMELNEDNAQRVSDVYSKIAAITASNVDEISTAMTKTASLASSANMSFENTAAFLAQIIETTRESADTAGTALKTVIARFSEMKSNPAELIDVEGEEVSYNKVDKALRSVGISLDAFMNGTEGLDSVFMRLSAKWDTLDMATQRYIATMAAGSRQQSRFIALMQDYGRMQELTTEATNAEGSATEQYNKTLDSMESKLNRLKNAWDQFTMSIANSELLKTAVDLATKLLETINKITDSCGDLGGAIIKIGGLIGTFKIGKLVGKAVGDTLIKEFAKQGSMSAGQFIEYFKNGIQNKGFFDKPVQVDFDIINNNKNNTPINKFDNEMNYYFPGEYSKKINEASSATEQLAIRQEYLNRHKQDGVEITEEYQQVLDQESKNLETSQYNVSQVALSYAALATAAAAVFSIIGQLFDEASIGRDIFEGLAVGASVAAAGFALIPPVLKVLSIAGVEAQIALWPLIIIMAAIAAAVAVVVIAIKHIKKNSIEGKIESVNKNLDSLNEQLNTVTDNINTLTDAIDQIKEYDNSFDSLVTGSEKFNEQLKESNDYVLALLEKFPNLKVSIGENGRLIVDSKSLEEEINKNRIAENNIKNAQFGLENYQRGLEKQKELDGLYNSTWQDFQNNAVGNKEISNWDWGFAAPKIKKRIQEIIDNGGDTDQIDQLLDEYADFDLDRSKVIALANAYRNKSAGIQINDNILSALIGQVDQEITSTTSGQTFLNAFSKLNNGSVNNRIQEIIDNDTRDLKTLQQAYADMVHIDVEDIDSTIKNDSTALKAALASSDVYGTLAEGANQFYANYAEQIAKGGSTTRFLNILSGDISNLTNEDLAYIDSDGSDDGLLLQNTLDELGLTLNEFCEQLGVTADELVTRFSEISAELYAQAKKVDIELRNSATKILKLNKNNNFDINKYKNDILDTLDSLDISIKNSLNETLKSIEESGLNIGEALLTGIASSIEEADAFINLTNQLNPQDAINSYAKLISAQNQQGMSDAYQKYVSSLLENEAFSPGKQLQQYLYSGDYSESLKSIEKIIKKNSRLTSNDIKELADDSELLATMLDNDILKTETLATVLTKLSVGEITIDGLTDRVVKAIDQFNSFESMLSETAAKLKNFDFGESASEQVEELGTQYEKLQALIKKRAFADPQTIKYLEYFLGDNAKNYTTIDQITEKVAQLEQWVKGNGAGFWDQYATGLIETSDLFELTKNAYGDYEYTLKAGTTTLQLAQDVADRTGQSLEAAQAYVEKIISLSPELKDALAQNDYYSALNAFADSLTLFNGKLFVAEEELNTVAKMAGKTPEEVLDNLKTMFSDEVYAINFQLLLTDEDGNEVDASQFVKNIANELNTSVYGLTLDIGFTAEGNIDFEKYLEQAKSYGMSDEQATKYVEGLAKETHGLLQSEVAAIEWDEAAQEYKTEMVTVYGETREELEKNIEDAQKEADYTAIQNGMADAVAKGVKEGIAEAFDGLEISIDGKIVSVDITGGAGKGTLPSIEEGMAGGYDKKFNNQPKNLLPLQYYVTNGGKGYKSYTPLDEGKDKTGGVIFGSDKYGDKSATETKNTVEEIVNDIDKLYNILQKISNLQQRINYYTKQYDNLINYGRSGNNSASSLTELLKLKQKELDAYDSEIDYLKQEVKGRQRQAVDLASQYSEFFEYDAKNNVIEINYDKFNSYAGKYETNTDESKESYDNNKKAYDDAKDALSKLEGYVSDIDNSNNELFEIQSAVEELKLEGLDEYITLEERVVSALDQIQRNGIEKLQNIADAVNNSNQAIVNKIQQQIDEYRSQRELDNSKNNLDDKRRQLAYLKQDTSGGNRQAILALERDLASAEQDYTDTLIDQMIKKMQTQNEIAQEQAQQQIDILTSIADWNKESGALAEQAMYTIANSFDSTTGKYLGNDSELYRILSAGEQLSTQTLWELQSTDSELTKSMLQAGSYLALHWKDSSVDLLSGYATGADLSLITDAVGDLTSGMSDTSLGQYVENNNGMLSNITESTESIGDKLDNILDALINIGNVTGTKDNSGSGTKSFTYATEKTGKASYASAGWQQEGDKWWYATSTNGGVGGNGTYYANGWQFVSDANGGSWYYFDSSGYVDYSKMMKYGSDGNYGVDDQEFRDIFYVNDGDTATGIDNATGLNITVKASEAPNILSSGSKGEYVVALQQALASMGYYTDSIDGKFGPNTYEAVTKFQAAYGCKVDGKVGPETKEKLKKLGYKNGGLVDFTGLAWLDGTPSKPEIVLNANDSATFMEFINLLKGWSGSSSNNTSQNSGVSYYNIDINVEEIANDYDVSDMMSQLEKEIERAAATRNNTTVRRS